MVLAIKDLKILMCEFIPFGRNAMVAFNEKLDAFKKVRNNLITSFKEENPGKTSTIEINPVKTRTILISFKSSEFCNLVAELVYPEDEGIVQKESIGVSINQYGRVILGMDILDMENNSEKFEFDNIPTMIIDLSEDSSKLLTDLLSEHQRELLNLTYAGRPNFRQKYFILLGSSLLPDGDINSYLDSDERETELKQNLEYIETVHQLKNGDRIFVGTSSSIVISDELENIEPVLTQFAFVRAIGIFISNYFSRLFAISDEIKRVKEMATQFNRDPRAVGDSQTALASITADCVLMGELCQMIKSAIKTALNEFIMYKSSFNEIQLELAEKLKIEHNLQTNYDRTDDIFNLIKGLENDVGNLENRIDVIQEKRLQQIFRGIKETGQIQRRTQKFSERQDNKMQVLEIIMSGSLAFEILTVLVGEFSFSSSNLNIPTIFGKDINNPLLWFLINLVVWIGLVVVILKLLKRMTDRADDNLTVFINYDRKINLGNFNIWLDRENIEIISAEIEETDDKVQRSISLELDLDGKHILTSIIYDSKNSFLHNVSLDINRPKQKNKTYYESLITEELIKHKVIKPNKYINF